MGIEITNLYRGGELKVGFKGKNGKSIHFTYGMVITEEMADKELIKASLENGKLSNYLKKGWVATKKINVKGAIMGTPQDVKVIKAAELPEGVAVGKQEQNTPPPQQGISDKTVDAALEMERKATEEPKIITPETVVAEAITSEPKPEKVEATETAPKKRGRPKKQIDAAEVKDISEIEPTEPVETTTPTEPVKESSNDEEDDFI